MRPVWLGICAAFFFAVTFILNRSMSLSGGSWMWSASLRYTFMVPFLLVIVVGRGNLRPLLQEMGKNKKAWLLWSFVGFGLFYAPLTFAAAFGPGWLVAGTWQATIVCGSLLAPLFYETLETSGGAVRLRRKIPFKGLSMSLLILVGIAVMQIQQAQQLPVRQILIGMLPVLIACFAYPLGNRKMMEVCGGRLDTYQRVLGMTAASMPLWLLLSLIGWIWEGPPSSAQTIQSLIVAISSGVIATVLFFMATDAVKHDIPKLAAVEATQSVAVLFTAIGEVVLLGMPVPSLLSCCGIALVIMGMVLHSFFSSR